MSTVASALGHLNLTFSEFQVLPKGIPPQRLFCGLPNMVVDGRGIEQAQSPLLDSWVNTLKCSPLWGPNHACGQRLP